MSDSASILHTREAHLSALLVANLNSLALDFAARNAAGGTNLNFFIIKQLPVLPPSTYSQHCSWQPDISLAEWIARRVLELTYTAWDMQPWAQDMGYDGPPFKWDEERRFSLRCELDAAFFHLYLGPEADWGRRGGKTYHADSRETTDAPELRTAFPSPRHAIEHIMDSFPIVRKKDEAKYSLPDGTPDFKTKSMILELYDRMQSCMTHGTSYETILSPPPASPEVAHPMSKLGILAFGSLINDPGAELEPLIVRRFQVDTPFGVEYGRSSAKRGGGPTLVPHEQGEPVRATVLVLRDEISTAEAMDKLCRRERDLVGDISVTYSRQTTVPNAVIIDESDSVHSIEKVLYTNFNPAGKLEKPEAGQLAALAIASVKVAKPGEDGVSYLMNAKAAGITTKLTADYEAAILRKLGVTSLQAALEKARD